MGRFFWGFLFVLFFSFSAEARYSCAALLAMEPNDRTRDLSRYESARILDMEAEKYIETFQSQTGITVTERNADGTVAEVLVRVLVDNPHHHSVELIGDHNDWGRARAGDVLHKGPHGTYYEAKIRGMFHHQQYRLRVDGKELLDPSATIFTAPGSEYLNSIFWDFDRPGAYHMRTHSVDLRTRAPVIAETEIWALAAKWPRHGGEGPRLGAEGPEVRAKTYRFIADSGIIGKLKEMGYNAVEFLPFNTSVDGDAWHLRYQVFGGFGPDLRNGTPDDFAYLCDKFNQAGIAVILDTVASHYPFHGNSGLRELGPVGLHQWKKADGRLLFGDRMSPWDTYRYDYESPLIRRFLIDGVMTMFRRYGISGIRFDNLDGIRFEPGGWEFLRELVAEVRRYRPEALLIGEMFFGENMVMQRHDRGGLGMNLRTHSTLFDFFKDNFLARTEDVSMAELTNAIRKPWEWGEAPRVCYLTNHDEAANGRGGATGQYVASMSKGGGWYYVERKTKAFATVAMVAGAATMDMPQLRLLQEGNFSHNPAVDWSLLQHESQRKTSEYFSALSRLVGSEEAFAFHNLHPYIENHTDHRNKVISFWRIDFRSQKRFLVVVNLGHDGMHGYRMGIPDAGRYRVLIDSERGEFGGDHHLGNLVRDNLLHTDGYGEHGKANAINIPYLAPYSAVVLGRE